MGTAYLWKTGYQKVSADIAGKEFERIDRERGLTAQAVVDESRAEDAPLHKAFEWDDVIAGEEWRKQQARVMISNLVIRIEDRTDSPEIRAFIKLEESPVYESTKIILQTEDKRASMMRLAMKELLAFRRKFSDIKEFSALFTEIGKLEKGVELE